MRYLADTHAMIWWWSGDSGRRLSERVRALMTDPATVIFISAVTGWEMATKVRAGRLPEMNEPVANFDESVTGGGFLHLDMRHEHAVAAGLLPGGHRDPFDRILAAQALIEGLTVITRDPALAAFGCKVIW